MSAKYCRCGSGVNCTHCRAAIIGSSSQTIPIVDGQLLLGRYQSIFFLELDRAKPRKVFIQVIGD